MACFTESKSPNISHKELSSMTSNKIIKSQLQGFWMICPQWSQLFAKSIAMNFQRFSWWGLYWKSFETWFFKFWLSWRFININTESFFTVQGLDGSHCGHLPVSCRFPFSLRSSTRLKVLNSSFWRLDRTSPIIPQSATPFHRVNTPSTGGQIGRAL